MIVTFRSGREVARWYAHERPALPAPMITTSDTARSYIMLKYLYADGALVSDVRPSVGLRIVN